MAANRAIEAAAPQNTRVLISGEPGTEKELVAGLIHEKSPRRELPFIVFDLAAGLSAGAVSLALLGGEKGSTTADLEKKTGLLEQARGGTLLINNVEFLPVELLPRLEPAEARLLGASGEKELPENIVKFFGGAKVILPALRERITDVPLLVADLLEELSARSGRETPAASPEALDLLSNYSWPGNTRQLTLLLERWLLNVKNDRLTEDDLPLDILLLSPDSPGSDYLAGFEKSFKET